MEIKHRKSFGFTKNDLNDLSHSNLNLFFRGIYNLDIPNEILELMNPDEITAKYIGAGLSKRDNAHLKVYESKHWENSFEGFWEIIRKLDSAAFPLIRREVEDWRIIYSNKKGEQKIRLSNSSPLSQRILWSSYFEMNRPLNSDAGCLDKKNTIYDPNIDGRSKRAYSSLIYDFFDERKI